MEMEVEKLNDFLTNCCRVCLSIENEMVDSSNIVENFNKTIDQLLFECANLKITNDIIYPKKLCEDCTTELVMVAKFREKCGMSAVALDQLKRQISKMNQSDEIEQTQIQNNLTNANTKDSDSTTDPFYENIEYTDENVEYVIYDTSTDLIEETDYQDKSQDALSANDVADEDTTYECNETSSQNTKATTAKNSMGKSKKAKRSENSEKKLAMKSIIKYHCKLCGAGFAQMNNYTRHLQTHNDCEIDNDQIVRDDEHSSFKVGNSIEVSAEDTQQQENCNILTTNPTEQQARPKRNLQKNHICQYCDRAFPSVSLLTTHTRIHTGERPFKCDICSKSFKTQGALDLHARRHSGLKPFECMVCGRGFVESSNLKVHMRSHTGEKPHQCVICGRSFSRVFLLQIHQRTHTGEKPYSCGTCDKSFAQQGDLAAHKRIHSGERPHRCKICQKGFIKSSGLTQHMRRHFRPSKMNARSSADVEENEQIELINIEQNIKGVTNSEKIMICYKEYNENSESFDEYMENC